MRQLVYFVAVSLDGRIAGPTGDADFFPFDLDYGRQLAEQWSDGLPTGLHEVLGTTPPRSAWDAVVMGRGSFQPALDAGVADPYAHLDTYVYSRSLDPDDHPAVTVVADDPVTHVRCLKAGTGGDIWLCGGGELAGTLADEIDRLVLKISPVTVGEGIPLLGGPFGTRSWRLTVTRFFDLGVILAEYDRVR